MPYRISAPHAITGYRTGENERAPRWADGVTFIRDDAAAELAYFLRRPDVYGVEQVATVTPDWAEAVAELRARALHGNVTRPDTVLDGAERNDRARAALVTPEQVAAVVAAIEGV